MMSPRFVVIPKGIGGLYDVIEDKQLDKIRSPRFFFDRNASEYHYLDLTDAERIQAIQEIGLEKVISILQQEYDALGKPYDATDVMDVWTSMIERTRRAAEVDE
jgi:hypothetical protein